MQRLEDLSSPPEVGRFYLVPCVTVGRNPANWTPGRWPVQGPLHSDAEVIGFASPHFHLDLRFLSKRQICNRLANKLSVGGPGHLRTEHVFLTVLTAHAVELRTELRPRKCVRLMPRHPFNISTYVDKWSKWSTPWIFALEEAYADRKLSDCKTCPHRGFRLASVPDDADGAVTCPGHGLRWNRRTGALVRRKTIDESAGSDVSSRLSGV